MKANERADVVIVGGAIIGSSVATFLASRPDFDGRIVVVERDPTFRTSSTTLSAASIRLQFSTALNIEISRFGIELIKHPDRYIAVDGEVPEFGFVENGYLVRTGDGYRLTEKGRGLIGTFGRLRAVFKHERRAQ